MVVTRSQSAATSLSMEETSIPPGSPVPTSMDSTILHLMQQQMVTMQLQFKKTVTALTSQMDDLRCQRSHLHSLSTSNTLVTPSSTLAHSLDEVDNEEFKTLYKLLKLNSQKKVKIRPPSPYDGKRDQRRIDQWLFKLETYFSNF